MDLNFILILEIKVSVKNDRESLRKRLEARLRNTFKFLKEDRDNKMQKNEFERTYDPNPKNIDVMV